MAQKLSKRTEPYKHDCDRCQFIGWHIEQAPGPDGVFVNRLSNMYICPSPDPNGWHSLIHRYSDEPSDYSCTSFSFAHPKKPHSIGVNEDDDA